MLEGTWGAAAVFSFVRCLHPVPENRVPHAVGSSYSAKWQTMRAYLDFMRAGAVGDIAGDSRC